MAKHLVLIGFSCTGKTSLGRSVFGERVVDSDDEILRWVEKTTQKRHDHIYQVYMENGRDRAMSLIERAEKSLIAEWANDPEPRIISLGPGFPLRCGWEHLRARSNVVLFRRSDQGIYDSLKGRRDELFQQCPEAKLHDNWDVGVMVDEQRTEYAPPVAVNNISLLLAEREQHYRDNDAEVNTDDCELAKIDLQAIQARFAAEPGAANDPARM